MTRLLGTAEAARRVGVSVFVIRQWRSRGYLDRTGRRRYLQPVGYVGKEPRYTEADVLAAEREVRLATEARNQRVRRDWGRTAH